MTLKETKHYYGTNVVFVCVCVCVRARI